jgi:hypothetical protein
MEVLYFLCENICCPFCLYGSTIRHSHSYHSHQSDVITVTPVPICNIDENDSRKVIDATTDEKFICSICMETPKQVIFNCGHMVCIKCSSTLILCPYCRKTIRKKIRMYNC